jgi:DnaJ-class molecular chaperone
MVKVHHPDVAGSSQPDSDKFREVMEAFGVLSVRESRVNYDLLRRKNPDNYREISEE